MDLYEYHDDEYQRDDRPEHALQRLSGNRSSHRRAIPSFLSPSVSITPSSTRSDDRHHLALPTASSEIRTALSANHAVIERERARAKERKAEREAERARRMGKLKEHEEQKIQDEEDGYEESGDEEPVLVRDVHVQPTSTSSSTTTVKPAVQETYTIPTPRPPPQAIATPAPNPTDEELTPYLTTPFVTAAHRANASLFTSLLHSKQHINNIKPHVHAIIPHATSCSSLSSRLQTVKRRDLAWSQAHRIATEAAATAAAATAASNTSSTAPSSSTTASTSTSTSVTTSISTPDLHRPSKSTILTPQDYPPTIPDRIDIHPEYHERVASRAPIYDRYTWDDDEMHTIMNQTHDAHTTHEEERNARMRLKTAMSNVTSNFMSEQSRREEETNRKQESSWAMSMEMKRRQRPVSAPIKMQRHDAPHVELATTIVATTEEKTTGAPYLTQHRYTQPQETHEEPHFIPQAWSRVKRSSSEIDAVMESQEPPPPITSTHAVDDLSDDDDDDTTGTSDGAFGDVHIRRRLAQERRKALQIAREEEEAEARREWAEAQKEEREAMSTKQMEWASTALGVTPLGVVEEDPAIARQAAKEAAEKREQEAIEAKKRAKTKAMAAIQAQFMGPQRQNKSTKKKKKKKVPSITTTLARQVEKTLTQRIHKHEVEQKQQVAQQQHQHTLETGIVTYPQPRTFDVAFGKNIIRSNKKSIPSKTLSHEQHMNLIRKEKKQKEKEEKENVKPRPYSGSYQKALEHAETALTPATSYPLHPSTHIHTNPDNDVRPDPTIQSLSPYRGRPASAHPRMQTTSLHASTTHPITSQLISQHDPTNHTTSPPSHHHQHHLLRHASLAEIDRIKDRIHHGIDVSRGVLERVLIPPHVILDEKEKERLPMSMSSLMINPFAPTQKSTKKSRKKSKKSNISADEFLNRMISGKMGAFKSIQRHAAESGLGEVVVKKEEQPTANLSNPMFLEDFANMHWNDIMMNHQREALQQVFEPQYATLGLVFQAFASKDSHGLSTSMTAFSFLQFLHICTIPDTYLTTVRNCMALFWGDTIPSLHPKRQQECLWPNLRYRHDPWLPAHHISRLEFMQSLVRLAMLKSQSRDAERAQVRGQIIEITSTSIPIHESFHNLCHHFILNHALHVPSTEFRIRVLEPAIQILFVKHHTLLHTFFSLKSTDDALPVRELEKLWSEMGWYDHRIIRKALSQAFGIIEKASYVMTYMEFLEVLTRIADLSADLPVTTPDTATNTATATATATATTTATVTATNPAPATPTPSTLTLSHRLENIILSLIHQFQTFFTADMMKIEKEYALSIKRDMETRTMARAAQQIREAEEREREKQWEQENKERQEHEIKEKEEKEATEAKSSRPTSSQRNRVPASPLSPITSVASIKAEIASSHQATMQQLAQKRHAEAEKKRQEECEKKEREARRLKLEKEKEMQAELSGAAKARAERLARKSKHQQDAEAKQKQEREKVRKKAAKVMKKATGQMETNTGPMMTPEGQQIYAQQWELHQRETNITTTTYNTHIPSPSGDPDRMRLQADHYLASSPRSASSL